jgi:hypothetical protein
MSKILSIASELNTLQAIKRYPNNFNSRGFDVPRGIRNNNPGNIEKNPANAWEGRVPLKDNTDGRFEQFTTYAYGVRALIMLLRTYINSGRNTITAIFNLYAPAGENNTKEYINFVAGKLGISSTAIITLNKNTLKELSQAIAKMENGQDCINDTQFEEGFNLLSSDVKTSIAQSFAFQEGYSYPFYDTGEHAILGQYIKGISASPIASVPELQPSQTYSINGIPFTYGQIITTGDFYEDFDSLKKAKPTQLTALLGLINNSEEYYTNSLFNMSNAIKNPENNDWKNIIPKYYDYAARNNSHFAPAISGFSTTIKANHKQYWEKYHSMAIQKARAGNNSTAIDEAIPINAYADHYLTDAFSAGHLVNKEYVMQTFLNNCFNGANLKPEAEKMLENIADGALNIPGIKSELAKWEVPHKANTATKIGGGVLGGLIGGPAGAIAGYLATKKAVGDGLDLDTTTGVKVFYEVLKEVIKDPAGKIEIANLAVKAVHDHLNNYPGGVPVVNAKGVGWNLTGDGTLNIKNIERIQEAVKQSVENISFSVSNMSTPENTLFKKVWDFVPNASLPQTKAILDATVANLTNPNSIDLINKAVDLLKNEVPLLLEKLKEKGKIVKKK